MEGRRSCLASQRRRPCRPPPKASGLVYDYETVWGASSGRLRRFLEEAPTKRIHLCREADCKDRGDYALHAPIYNCIEADDLLEQSLTAEEHRRTRADQAWH